MKRFLSLGLFLIFGSCAAKVYTPISSSIKWKKNNSGNVKIINQEIRLLSAAPQKSYAYFSEESYKNFKLELEVFSPIINDRNKKRAAASNQCSIAFAIEEKLSEAYQFQINYLKEKFVLFYDDEVLKEGESFKDNYKLNTWNKLKIDFVDSVLTVSLNDKEILRKSGLKTIKGKIALVHQGGHSKVYSFRKIKFKKYKVSFKK